MSTTSNVTPFNPGGVPHREVAPGSVASIVALANRMRALKSSPGFHDLEILANMLKDEAIEAAHNYEGWDDREIAKLNAQAQTARNLVRELFARIDGAISNARGLPGLEGETNRPEDMAPMRIPGSY